MKTVKRHLAVLLTLAIVIGTMALPSLAAGGDGSGGGDGGGKDRPLIVEASQPEAGGTINPDGSIVFTFSKNVVFAPVRDNNAVLFKMQDQDGNDVAIEVEMADDQIEPDKRNDIVLNPVADLEGGKTYTATALEGIQSKSGHVMEEDYVLTFVVSGGATEKAEEQSQAEATKEETPAKTEEEKPIEEKEVDKEEKKEEAPPEPDNTPEPETEEPEEIPEEPEKSSNTMIIVIVIGAVVVVAIIVIVVRRKKND